MSARRVMGGTVRRSAYEIVGWTLLIAGVAALVLPGPGLLMMFFGILVLSRHYVWADRFVDGLERKAMQGARESVETWPRIGLGVLGGAWLAACGVVWSFGLIDIPVFTVLGFTVGPELPFEGWGVGLVLIASAIAAWALIGYSVARFRYGTPDRPAPVAQPVE